jgi:hypothetical protein
MAASKFPLEYDRDWAEVVAGRIHVVLAHATVMSDLCPRPAVASGGRELSLLKEA